MESRATTLTVVPRGELDLASADALLTRVRTAVRAGPFDVTVDASGVTFIDCAGLNALLVLWKELAARGCAVELVASAREVVRLLSLTGVTEQFGLDATAADGDRPVPDGETRADEVVLIVDLDAPRS